MRRLGRKDRQMCELKQTLLRAEILREFGTRLDSHLLDSCHLSARVLLRVLPRELCRALPKAFRNRHSHQVLCALLFLAFPSQLVLLLSWLAPLRDNLLVLLHMLRSTRPSPFLPFLVCALLREMYLRL